MDFLNKDQLKTLVNIRRDPAISIFMPTHKQWNHMDQDIIRFKNILKKIGNDLSAKEFTHEQIDKLLTPAKELLDDKNFWNYQDDGLAIFLSADDFYSYRLPVEFDEFYIISKRFYIKPVIPAMEGNEKYYVLALDLNKIKLFKGTRYTFNEIELKNITTNFQDAMKYNDPERTLNFHKASGASSADQSGALQGHGQGFDERIHKKNILEFFRMVDKGVAKLLNKENVPLVLAGLEYLVPIYMKANSYSNIIDDWLDINPEKLSDDSIHKKSWNAVEPVFKQDQKKALKNFENFINTGRTSTNIEDIIKAAHVNKIDSLMISPGFDKWGIFNSDTHQVTFKQKDENDSVDLVDFAAAQTILNNGTVYLLSQENMPEGLPLAAVYRY